MKFVSQNIERLNKKSVRDGSGNWDGRDSIVI